MSAAPSKNIQWLKETPRMSKPFGETGAACRHCLLQPYNETAFGQLRHLTQQNTKHPPAAQTASIILIQAFFLVSIF